MSSVVRQLRSSARDPAKFEQNPNLREFLLNTKERVLVEASLVDRIWGIGLASKAIRLREAHQETAQLLPYAAWPGSAAR